ncbi:MAG: hypothetical protein JAY75_19770 [Candidatus Thiodiazotropha taylori]|nr:hypothetical protein [Candidatus Thiodiazotropha taylori]MCW4310459.1 hypothetical protein [Candidatus Thiodiazotropha endolucinida]
MRYVTSLLLRLFRSSTLYGMYFLLVRNGVSHGLQLSLSIFIALPDLDCFLKGELFPFVN